MKSVTERYQPWDAGKEAVEKMPKPLNWKSLKPGYRIRFGLFNEDAHRAIFICRGEDTLVVLLDHFVAEYSLGDIAFIKLVSKKRSRKFAHFRRSDGYEFVIYRSYGEWVLSAGCRDFTEPTLKALKKEAHAFWDDGHKVFALSSSHVLNERRKKLNRESRRKITKAIKSLS